MMVTFILQEICHLSVFIARLQDSWFCLQIHRGGQSSSTLRMETKVACKIVFRNDTDLLATVLHNRNNSLFGIG